MNNSSCLQKAKICLSLIAHPEKDEISLLVIHNISLPPGEFGGGYVEQFFQNILDPQAHPYFDEIKELKVSSHLFIERDGSITQFVPFDRRPGTQESPISMVEKIVMNFLSELS